MINAVIFDLWSTLGGKHTSISRSTFKKFRIPMNRKNSVRYERSVQLKKWKTMDQMAISFLKEFNLSISQRTVAIVKKAFQHAIRNATPFPGIKTLLGRLHRHYKLALLSNTTCFESEVPNRWGFDGLFDVEVYSWKIGSIKPCRRNFQISAKRLGVKMEECLFVDDNIINVLAAKRFGMKAIQFQNVGQLKRELHALNIKF